MKLRIIVIFLLLLAPTTGRALSADDSPLQAELRGAGEAASPALVYFGGTSPELRVRLSGVFHGDLAVKATLQQQSAPLSAAFPESVPVLDEQTLRVEGSLSVPFTMAFPPVRAESHFKLRLWGRSGHTGDWQELGSTDLVLFPRDMLGPLRGWARSHELAVRDDSHRLGDFFRASAIPFFDCAAAGASTEICAAMKPDFYLEAPSTAAGSASVCVRPLAGSSIFFRESSISLPSVTIRSTGRRTRIDVAMQMLDGLPTDPRAQRLLLELFGLAQHDEATNDGSDL